MRLALVLLLLSATANAADAIDFSVKQMGVAVNGGFKRFTARIDLDPAHLDRSSAEITVDVASVSTGIEEGDQTAIDQAWLDVAEFPKATFTSTSVRSLGSDRYEAKGVLSIRGKTRDISVPFLTRNQAHGSTVVTGDFTIRRTDFGIGAAQGCASAAGAGCAGAAGGEWDDLVADEVPIHFRLTLSKESP